MGTIKKGYKRRGYSQYMRARNESTNARSDPDRKTRKSQNLKKGSKLAISLVEKDVSYNPKQ
jgi:hypothetical protein